MSYPDDHFQNGLSVMVRCKSKNCWNYSRYKVYYLGYGNFTKKGISKLDRCDRCKSHKATPFYFESVAIVIKKGVCLIDRCETEFNEPNPIKFFKFENN